MATQKTALIGPLRIPVLLTFLPFSFIAFMLPIYGKNLDASAMSVGGLFSIVTASTLIFRPFVGRALDQFGRKKFFITGLLLNMGAMIAFMYAGTLPYLYLARFIQGFAFLFLTISLVTMVADMSSNADRGKAMGIRLEKETQGRIIGIFLGLSFFGFFSAIFAWRLAFICFAIMTVVAIWLSWRRIPETQPSAISVDGGDDEDRQSVPIQLIKLMVVVFVIGITFSMLMPISLVFMQDRFTTDIGTLALVFLPGGMALGFLSSRLGKLSDRFGRITMMFLGFILTGLSFLFVPLAPSMISLAGIFFLIHIGWATVDPAQSALVADIVDKEHQGKSYGWYDFSRSLGLTTGPLLGGWLYDTLGPATPFYFCSIVLLCGGVWVILLMGQSASFQKEQGNHLY